MQRALAEIQLAPHVKEGTQIATPEVAVAEFEQWLDEPPDTDRPLAEMELADLIGPGRR